MIESFMAAARAAAELLGLAAALDEPRSAADLAALLGAGPARLGWLLDLLAAEGTLARDAGRYRLARALAPARASGARLMAAVIRRDRPLAAAEVVGSLEAAALTCHRDVVRVPPELVAQLAALAGSGTLLDAGCGDGAIAEAVLAANAGARAVLADRDLRPASRLLVGERATALVGDLLEVALPPARVALLSHVLHTMSAAAAERLVARAAAAVEPGGALVVREIALADDRTGPRFGLAFGLSMSLHADAELPAAGRIAGWLTAAGLTPRPPRPMAESIVIEATKPAAAP